MAITENIEITVSIPADVLAALQTGGATDLDAARATIALKDSIQTAPKLYKIVLSRVETGTEYEIWASSDWCVLDVLYKLEQVHGIERQDHCLWLSGDSVPNNVKLCDVCGTVIQLVSLANTDMQLDIFEPNGSMLEIVHV